MYWLLSGIILISAMDILFLVHKYLEDFDMFYMKYSMFSYKRMWKNELYNYPAVLLSKDIQGNMMDR